MIAYALHWRIVALIILAHVAIDAGSTFLAWHQSIGDEKWAAMHWNGYEAFALYAKLVVGICTTILTLRDNTWAKTRESSPQ